MKLDAFKVAVRVELDREHHRGALGAFEIEASAKAFVREASRLARAELGPKVCGDRARLGLRDLFLGEDLLVERITPRGVQMERKRGIEQLADVRRWSGTWRAPEKPADLSAGEID